MVSMEKKPRRLIAVDEACVNVNGENYWVYSAID
jgi:transposase-like protein